MELLTKLGIDWKLLLAQIVNFVILLAILYKFLYKPVIKLLEDRQAKIEKSLKQAEEIQKNLYTSEGEKAKVLEAARGEAGKIVAESREMAIKVRDEMLNKAKMEAANIVDSGKKELLAEKETMMRDAKTELADILKMAAEKIIKEKLDSERDAALIEKTITEI